MPAPDGPPPCIVCGNALNPVEPGGLQPLGALAMTSPGHYGSGAFDPLDDTVLQVNVCDNCLIDRADRVLRVKTTVSKTVTREAARWDLSG